MCRLPHCCQPRGGQGQGWGGRSVQTFGNEVHAGRTRVCTSHVKMPVLARVLPFFLLFFLGILSPSTHIFYSTPPKQNTTSLANEKDPCDKEAQHTVVACITLLQYWVNCFILLFTILFTSTYKHHQLCKFPLLCLFQACPAQLMIGGKDAQACRTRHAQHVA